MSAFGFFLIPFVIGIPIVICGLAALIYGLTIRFTKYEKYICRNCKKIYSALEYKRLRVIA